MDTATNIAVGLATAVLGWVIAQGLLRPRLRWSRQISKRCDADGGVEYRAKMKNASWFRSATDVRLQARVLGYGIDPTRSGTSISIRLKTAPSDMKTLGPRRNTLVYFHVAEIDSRMLTRLERWGHTAAAGPDRRLEDLLALGRDTIASIQVLANDGWTGGTHYSESPRYVVADITTDPFLGTRSHLDRLHAASRRAIGRAGMPSRWRRLYAAHPELRSAPSKRADTTKPESSTTP